jgi:peptidoglycan/LPS O-acetylase OafA/YrhL
LPGTDLRTPRNTLEQRPSGRSFLIDAVKACGCLLIVLHHMAFYGPMSDVVATAWPAVISWLHDHGRLAVQLFLVCGGFLTAGSVARMASLTFFEALQLAEKRYLRLAIPMLAALSFTVLITEWVRPDFDHASLSATPEWGQAMAHVLMLQHLLDMDALSAGIWYVAIDFQLYAMTLLSLVVLGASRWPQTRYSLQTLRTALWLSLTCASWWWWNLEPELDDHGVYFYGAYGLGLLAWEARRHTRLPSLNTFSRSWKVWALLGVMGGVAWWLGPRWRMAVAFGVAAVLIAVPSAWFSGEWLYASVGRRALAWLSGVSYAVFLIHFGVSLAVSACITSLWPDALWANTMGMLVSLLLSLACGGLLHVLVERHAPSWWRWWLWAGVFKASVALALLINPVGG